MNGFTTEFVTAKMNSKSCSHSGMSVLDEFLSYSSHRNIIEYGVQPRVGKNSKRWKQTFQKRSREIREKRKAGKEGYQKELNFYLSSFRNNFLAYFRRGEREGEEERE